MWFPNILLWIVWIDDFCSRANFLHMVHDSYIEVCTSLVLRSSAWIDRSLRSFPHRRFVIFSILFTSLTTFNEPIARLTGWVSYLKQELKTFPEHRSSPRFLMGSLFLICCLCLLTLAIVYSRCLCLLTLAIVLFFICLYLFSALIYCYRYHFLAFSAFLTSAWSWAQYM